MAVETLDKMEGVYGDALFARQTIFWWRCQFKEGCEAAVLNLENCGRKHSLATQINLNTVVIRIKEDPYHDHL